MVCVCVFISRTPEGSTDSGSGEAGDQNCNPWFTRHSANSLHYGGFQTIIRPAKTKSPKSRNYHFSIFST